MADNADIAPRRYDNEVIGYIGFAPPEACGIKRLHLTEIRLSCSCPTTITHVPIPVSAVVVDPPHRCPFPSASTQAEDSR